MLERNSWENTAGTNGFDETYKIVVEDVRNLCSSLIEYQVKSVCTLFVHIKHEIINTIRNILVLDDWGGRLDRIKAIETGLDQRADTCLKVEVRNHLSDLVKQARSQLDVLQDISRLMKQLLEIEDRKTFEKASKRARSQLKLFDKTPYNTTLAKIPDRGDGTGNWLLEHPNYLNWKASNTGILAIEANPGRGKSVLAKSILSELTPDPNRQICYFFFNDGIKNLRKITTALCSILHQIFTSRIDVLKALGDEIEAKREGFTDDFETLWEILDLAIQKGGLAPTTCVFDALDECEQSGAETLLRGLQAKSKNGLPIKLLLTTRRRDYIRLGFENLSALTIVNLEEDTSRLQSLANDVDAVINRGFSAFITKHNTKIPLRKHEMLKARLRSYGEQRTYLWVKLVFRYLDTVSVPSSPEGWSEIFEALPVDLHAAYVRFLATVPKSNRKFVRQIFEMIVAAYEPLDVQQINIAVHIKSQRTCTPSSDLELSSRADFQTWIVENCGFLVDLFDHKLYFIHGTAREFLLASSNDARLDWLRSFELSSCHRLLAEKCIAYLSSPILVNNDSEICPIQGVESADSMINYPFFEYCALYWMPHVKGASRDGNYDVSRETDLVKSILRVMALKDQQDVAKRLNGFSNSLDQTYQMTGSGSTLMTAIGLAELAVLAIPVDDPDSFTYSESLSIQLGRRYELMGAIDDLERAVIIAHRAVDDAMAQVRPVERARLLGNLGNLLGRRFELMGTVEDLDQAIAVAQAALYRASSDHPYQAYNLAVSSVQVCRLFKQTGVVEHLDKAVELAQKAVAAAPDNCLEQSGPLAAFGSHLGIRFELLGATQEVDEAIRLCRMGVDLVPHEHYSRAGLLEILATQLGRKFDRFGDIETLVQAITVAEMAVTSTPENHCDKPSRFGTLADQLQKRFSRTGIREDLDRTIEVLERTLVALPPKSPIRASRMADLASQLGQRFGICGDSQDIIQAIEFAEAAIEIVPNDHFERARVLEILGHLLGRKFVGYTAPPSQPRERHQHLVQEYPRLFRWAGWIKALHQFRSNATKSSTSSDRSTSPSALVALDGQPKVFGSSTDIDRSILCFDEARQCSNAPLPIRVRVAWCAGSVLATQSRWEESCVILSEAVRLLFAMSSRSLSYDDNGFTLTKFTGLASMAAAVALNAGREASYALELLALGHAILTTQLLQMRTDTSRLRDQHPALAEEFEKLRERFKSPINRRVPHTSAPPPLTRTVPLQRRREAERSLINLVQEIRTQNGFQNFLTPPSAGDIIATANSDPMIVLSASPYRCDAFIVDGHHVVALELHTLSLEVLEQNDPFPSLSNLKWLWDTIAGPCLRALDLRDEPTHDDWPHVWWIPIGPFSLYSIHAAGQHDNDSAETVLDRVWSSYSMSVNALVYARLESPRTSQSLASKRALLVAMQETPGHATLSTMDEVKAIQECYTSLGFEVVKPKLHRVAVLEQLHSCNMFHFSGMSRADPKPLKANLLLDDWLTDPLTIADIRNLKLQRNVPVLSFLSTCDSAGTPSRGIVDEPMHFAGAFQLAGFRHVIGAQRSVSDQACVDVARVFYKLIQEEGLTDRSIHRGLHQAVRRLRDRERKTKPDDGLVQHREAMSLGTHRDWISFVHFGM